MEENDKKLDAYYRSLGINPDNFTALGELNVLIESFGFDFDQEVFHEAYLCYLEDKQEEIVDDLKPPHHVWRSKFVAFMAGVFDQLSERKQANESTGLTTES